MPANNAKPIEDMTEDEIARLTPEERVKAVLDLYRKMTPEERRELEAAQQEIDNA